MGPEATHSVIFVISGEGFKHQESFTQTQIFQLIQHYYTKALKVKAFSNPRNPKPGFPTRCASISLPQGKAEHNVTFTKNEIFQLFEKQTTSQVSEWCT